MNKLNLYKISGKYNKVKLEIIVIKKQKAEVKK